MFTCWFRCPNSKYRPLSGRTDQCEKFFRCRCSGLRVICSDGASELIIDDNPVTVMQWHANSLIETKSRPLPGEVSFFMIHWSSCDARFFPFSDHPLAISVPRCGCVPAPVHHRCILNNNWVSAIRECSQVTVFLLILLEHFSLLIRILAFSFKLVSNGTENYSVQSFFRI